MRYICTSIVATLLLAGTSFAQDAVEWRVEDGGNGHWYQVITAETGFPTYNPEAYFDLAESLGGYAVTITSENEDIFVYNLSLTVPGAWTIGPGFGPTLGARHLGGCSFEWITGEPWSYASWGPADPGCNGDYVAYCVCGQSTPNDTERWWVDCDPSYGGNLSGVIEYSADCNGDGIVDYGQILDGTYVDADGNGVPDPCDVPEADLTVDDDLLDYPEADFTSIQAAIDAAQDGDLILVYPGTYTGTGNYVVDFGAKQLQLIAAAGFSNTSIDGEDARGLINCSGYHDASTVIRGFSMTRANDTSVQAAINFHGESGPTLSECRIHDMTHNHHVNVLHAGPSNLGDPVGHPRIEWCTFENIDMSEGGRCLSFNYNNPVIEGCTFRNNVAYGHLCFSYWPNNTPTYIDCIFQNNITGVAGTDEPGVLVARAGSHVSLSGCTFSENTMYDSCVVYGSYDVADTAFCGNIPSNDICGSWTDLGGNEFLNEPCLSFVDCNENGVPDYDDINSGYSEDCNNNSVPDECDVANGTSFDCDQNGVPDECQPDCDGDGWIDPCDSDGDCDGDGVPDNCETDCNTNGIPDDCEIDWGIAQDCNSNGIPDECDIADGSALDCNGNDVPDSCELENDPSLDCNGDGVLDNCQLLDDCNANGVLDECDIDGGGSNDANGNGIPDECEDDCNANGVPDHWDIKTGTSEDCNANGIPDECDTADGTSNDVNGNSIPDECEADCNDNGSPDDWDVVTGWSEDCNDNLIPDECDIAAEGAVQWTVAEGGNGHWYEYNPTPTDWHSARSYASQQGGDLASISSVEENVFIHNLVPDSAWIGGTDEVQEGDWHWSNGDTWDYTNWGSGEPNNNDPKYGEDYTYIVGYDHSGGADFWYDGSVWTDDIAFVIEWEAGSFLLDCNANGILDECDIADETSNDINGDGVPDECQCLADIDGSGAVTIDDLLAVIGYWGSSIPAGDLNSDGTVDIEDLLIIFDAWGPCP